MKISVISVLYYSSHLVDKLIENIYHSIKNVDEILFINNSNDDKITTETKSNIKIINTERNLGYGGAINLGLQYVRNNNLIIMNPDIHITEFEFNFDSFKEPFFLLSGIHNEAYIVEYFPTPLTELIDLTIGKTFAKLSFTKKLFNRYNELDKNTVFHKVDWFSGALIITNKETMKQLGGFDDGYFLFYEEVDLCKRAKLNSISVLITDYIKYNSSFEIKSSSIDVNEIKLNSNINSLKRYHKKYSGKISTTIVLLIIKLFHLAILIILFPFKQLFKKNTKIKNKYLSYKIRYKTI